MKPSITDAQPDPLEPPSPFLGRDRELQEIGNFIAGNQCVSLVGPSRIGKSALLRQILRRGADQRPGPGHLFVYFDCGLLASGTHPEIFGRLSAALNRALVSRGLPPDAALAAAAASPGRLPFEAAIRRLNQQGLRVVLLLDQFERLSSNPDLDLTFYNVLRSAATRFELVFVTASARPLIQLTYAARSQEILSSPFFNIFAPIAIGLLAEDEARRLIRQLAQAGGMELSPSMEDFIYMLAGGHPAALHVACGHATAWGPAAADAYEELARRTTEDLRPLFMEYWDDLTPAEQEAARCAGAIALHASGEARAHSVLRDLAGKCLLVDAGQSYRYPSQAWERFVAGQDA